MVFIRNHATNFLSKKIQARFGQAERIPIMKWSRHFLLSTSLDEWCRRVKDIIIICGKQYYTPEVDEALVKLDEPLDIEG